MKIVYSIDYVPEDSRLTFIGLTGNTIGKKNAKLALYKCTCGVEKEIIASAVRTGQIKSCGCYTEQRKLAISIRGTTHGLSKHPLYLAYRNIIQRCENDNSAEYPGYGGRGVYMCSLWRNSFMEFYNWALLNGWRKGLNIDKDIIPKKLGIPAIIYSPEMCSIVSHKENTNAQSNNIEIEYLGRKQNLTQWTNELNIAYSLVRGRIKLGWSVEKAFTTPKMATQDRNVLGRKKILNTETGIIYLGSKEAAKAANLSESYMNSKLNGRVKNNTPFIYV